jgi:ERCC4-type nuclease
MFGALIDSREPDWVKHLRFGGVPVTVATLDAGDIHVATDDGLLVIERKTPDDLLASIKDGRLFQQCATMRKISQWSYVVITGELQRGRNGNVITARGETGWKWNAVQGALLNIQELGVYVTFCSGDNDFENAVVRLASRKRDEMMRIMPARTPVVVGHNVAILADFPNIGLDRAQALMEYCGSLAWALVALTDSVPVPGIGEVTKKLARATLGLRDDEEIVIQTKGGNDVQTSN